MPERQMPACLQAIAAGKKIKEVLDSDPSPCKLFFYISPYKARYPRKAILKLFPWCFCSIDVPCFSCARRQRTPQLSAD